MVNTRWIVVFLGVEITDGPSIDLDNAEQSSDKDPVEDNTPGFHCFSFVLHGLVVVKFLSPSSIDNSSQPCFATNKCFRCSSKNVGMVLCLRIFFVFQQASSNALVSGECPSRTLHVLIVCMIHTIPY